MWKIRALGFALFFVFPDGPSPCLPLSLSARLGSHLIPPAVASLADDPHGTPPHLGVALPLLSQPECNAPAFPLFPSFPNKRTAHQSISISKHPKHPHGRLVYVYIGKHLAGTAKGCGTPCTPPNVRALPGRRGDNPPMRSALRRLSNVARRRGAPMSKQSFAPLPPGTRMQTAVL